MASRLSRFDGQTSVEQHDALFGPGCQVAVGRHGHAQIVGQLGVDVRQTARNGLDVRCHAEAQSHRMARRGVGILADDKHFDVVEWNGKRAQNVPAGRKVLTSRRDFRPQKVSHEMYLGFDIGEGLGPSGLHKILQWFDMSHTFPLYDVPCGCPCRFHAETCRIRAKSTMLIVG